VRILGNQYLVVIDGHTHVVGKDRRCHTCHDECTAVSELARYLATHTMAQTGYAKPRTSLSAAELMSAYSALS
jgi:hypothetical protein